MSSFIIKIIALITMTIDHVGVYIPISPLWFHWIGRLSAPLFMFCAVYSFSNTKNKQKYIIRLYSASVLMGLIQFFLEINNNFYRVIFSTVIILHIIFLYQTKEKRAKKLLWIYIIWQTASIALIIFMLSLGVDETFSAYLMPAFLGSIFNLEGGLIFVLVGILIYISKNSRRILIVLYTGFNVAYFLITTTPIINIILSKLHIFGMGSFSDTIEYVLDTIVGLSPMTLGGDFLTSNYQWMMVFALPIYLLYNQKKGANVKWLFYVYYPLHIILLFILNKILLF